MKRSVSSLSLHISRTTNQKPRSNGTTSIPKSKTIVVSITISGMAVRRRFEGTTHVAVGASAVGNRPASAGTRLSRAPHDEIDQVAQLGGRQSNAGISRTVVHVHGIAPDDPAAGKDDIVHVALPLIVGLRAEDPFIGSAQHTRGVVPIQQNQTEPIDGTRRRGRESAIRPRFRAAEHKGRSCSRPTSLPREPE